MVRSAAFWKLATISFPVYNWGCGFRYIELLGLESQRHLPAIAAGLSLPQLLDDPRFNSPAARRQNRVELHRLLRERFLERTVEEWTPRLTDAGVWFQPHQTSTDFARDPQARVRG